jgi:hypothetical protein
MPDALILRTYPKELDQLTQLAFETASKLPAETGTALGLALVAHWWPGSADAPITEAITRAVRLGLAFAQIEDGQNAGLIGYIHPWTRECICSVSYSMPDDELKAIDKDLPWRVGYSIRAGYYYGRVGSDASVSQLAANADWGTARVGFNDRW